MKTADHEKPKEKLQDLQLFFVGFLFKNMTAGHFRELTNLKIVKIENSPFSDILTPATV